MKTMDKENYEMLRYATTLQACMNFNDNIGYNANAMSRALTFMADVTGKLECMKEAVPVVEEFRETLDRLIKDCIKINRMVDELLTIQAEKIVDLMEEDKGAEEGEQ